MDEVAFFNILNTVDSTNNYAMGTIHAGMAKHGMLWFAHDQTAGKGQRGKTWTTQKGQNIVMSLVLEPERLGFASQFHLSAAVALTCFEFFAGYSGDETKIKWPNDIFWRDRKAGGILIENKFKGKSWKWAVVGIGININQTSFEKFAIPAVSLKAITGKDFETVDLAKKLYSLLMKNLAAPEMQDVAFVLKQYNEHLYKINKTVSLQKDKEVFETVIKGVTANGRLVTVDSIEQEFDHGEVEWVLSQ